MIKKICIVEFFLLCLFVTILFSKMPIYVSIPIDLATFFLFILAYSKIKNLNFNNTKIHHYIKTLLYLILLLFQIYIIFNIENNHIFIYISSLFLLISIIIIYILFKKSNIFYYPILLVLNINSIYLLFIFLETFFIIFVIFNVSLLIGNIIVSKYESRHNEIEVNN